MDLDLLRGLAIGLLLGMLVGIERERSEARIAGIRTFTLITLLGVLTGGLAQTFGAWILAIAFVGVLALLVTGNLILLRTDRGDPGMTTEIAGLVMFMVGAALAAGRTIIAAVTAGVVALLLHWKHPLQRVIRGLGEAEVNAGMRLVLLWLVILPILPDRSYGPFGVLNPYAIWRMVVLIVGISLASYIAWRAFGPRAGTLLSGALGGLISSTAATVGYARRSRGQKGMDAVAAVMILIASAVVFLRVLFEIAIVVPGRAVTMGGPLLVMFLLMLAVAWGAWRRERPAPTAHMAAEPGSDLRAAILFGLLYAAVLFAVAAARERFGTSGLYAVAALSGLTDMDAITLSTAQLVEAQRLEAATAWRLILVAAMANLVFKGIAVFALGSRGLARRIAAGFAISLAGGALILLFWT